MENRNLVKLRGILHFLEGEKAFKALKKVRPEFFIPPEYLYLTIAYTEPEGSVTPGSCPVCNAGGFMFAGGAESYSDPWIKEEFLDGLIKQVCVTAYYRGGTRTKCKNVARSADELEDFCLAWLREAGLDSKKEAK